MLLFCNYFIEFLIATAQQLINCILSFLQSIIYIVFNLKQLKQARVTNGLLKLNNVNIFHFIDLQHERVEIYFNR